MQIHEALEYTLIREWKQEQTEMLKLTYPNATDSHISDFLDRKIQANLVNPNCNCENNYTNKFAITNLLDVTQFIFKKKPIMTERGVLFKQHNEAASPSNLMVELFIKQRKIFKNEMKKYLGLANEIEKEIGAVAAKSNEKYIEFMKKFEEFNLMQLIEKIKANSFYGASGLRSSVFYNLFTAISTTSKGQCLISTAGMAFEMFLENNVLFLSFDECMTFIKNVVSEREHREYNDDKVLDEHIPMEDLLDKLRMTFNEEDDYYKNERTLIKVLNNITQEDRNRLYYKNNIYDFFRNSKLTLILNKAFKMTDSFKDPNNVPESLSDSMDVLWNLCKEYVFYNYEVYDRINRLKYHTRKSAVVIDTDSNMVNLYWWHEFCNNEIFDNEIRTMRTGNENMYMSINIMCTMLTRMITDVLERFCINCNIESEEKRKLINMKNEFLFKRILLTASKKAYASIVLLKEGKEMPSEKQLDMKGLEIMKSTVSEDVGERFAEIMEKKILRSDDIDVRSILTDVKIFENNIRESLVKQSKEYLTPKSTSALDSYKTPYSEQQIRALFNWNYLNPMNSINPGEKIDILKVKLARPKDLIPLAKDNEEMYNLVSEKIFNSDIKEIANKGLDVIAIPKEVDKIPEWIVPYIDYDTIISDTLAKFVPIMNSVGMKKIHVKAGDRNYSNVISF